MAQQDYRKAVPRRSSIIAKQLAEEEGIEMQSSDVFRLLPPSVQAQVARQSNSRRSSNLAQSSINPTPINSVKSKKFGSGIPRPSSTARKPPKVPGTNRPPSESTNSRHPKPSLLSTYNSRPTMGMSAARQQMGSIQNLAKNSSLSFRRSLSVDSLCRDNGLTPGAYTPNWRTPATNKPGQHSDMSKYPMAKTIKVPASTDKRTLYNLAQQVNSFLQAKNYSRRMTLDEFFKMPSTEYVNICVFAGTLIMGSSYFLSKEVSEKVTKIFDLSKFLKYPGTITKSHLKCANIPNSWPYALTFLNWLCDRVERAISPDLFHKPISEISQNDYKELAAESYLVLFFEELNSGAQDASLLETELLSFKSKLQEKYMSDVPQTTEELEALRNAEKERLNRLENTPDPAKTLIDAKSTYEKLLLDAQDKLEGTKKKWNTYKDLASLHAQAKVLQSKFQEKEKQIQELQNVICNQPYDKRKQQQMMEEMKTFKNQIQTIETITKKLNHHVISQNVTKTNMEKKFYELCSRFTVVETFQQTVRRLRLDIPLVPPNPYEPSAFKLWVNEAEKTQQLASKTISAMQKELEDKRTKMERNKNQRLQVTPTLETKKANLVEDLKKKKADCNRRKNERELELTEMVHSEKQMIDEMSLLSNEMEAMNEEFAKLSVTATELRNLIKEDKLAEEVWRQKSEDNTVDVMNEGTMMNNFMNEYCVNKMYELREIRIRHNLNVEHYDEVLEEYATAGVFPNPAQSQRCI